MPSLDALRRRQEQRAESAPLSPMGRVSRQQTNLLARGLAVDPESETLRSFLERYGDDLDAEQLEALGVEVPKQEGGGGILGGIGRIVNAIPGAPQVLDLLDRPSQAILQTIDNVREGDNPLEGLYGGLSGRGEGGDGISATDALFGDGRGPGGVLGGALDFAGSVLTDPTTYLTFGASGLARTSLASLAREGAQEGLQSAAQAIGRKGLRGAIRAGEANLDDVTGFLSRQAAESGSRNVERTVNRQLRHLNRSAAGGVRFAGQTIPGTRGIQSAFHPLRRTSVLDEPAQGARRFSGLRDFGDRAFRTTPETARRFGDFVAGDVAQARTAGHAVAERAANQWAPELQRISQEIPKMARADDAIRAGLIDDQRLFDDVVTPDIAPDIQKVISGFRSQYDSMVDEGRKIGYQVPSIRSILDEATEVGDTAADALLRQATRIAASAGFQSTLKRLDGLTDNFGQRLVFDEATYRNLPAAGRPALEKIEVGGTRIYAPKEIASDVRKVMDYLTTDDGLRQFTAALNRANSLWKSYATVLPVGGGFFSRNEAGNVLSILMAGADMRSLGRAAKIQRTVRKSGPEALSAADRRVWELAGQEGVTEAGFIFQEASSTLANVRKATHKGGGGRLRQGLARINPGNIENSFLKAGRALNTTLENNARLALFADGIEKGMSPSAAAQRTKKYLFDYTDLTAIEREKIKPWVAFYTYMRNNIPLQANMLATKPGVLTAQAHGIESAQEAFGEGTPGLFPTYPFGGSAAVASPGGVFSFDLPLTSAAEQTAGAFNAARDLILKRDPKAAMQFVLNQTSGIRPALAETMMEVALERDLFTGRELTTLSDRQNQVVDAMFPGVRKTRRSIEQISSTDRAQLLPFFLGVGYVPINESTQISEMYNRLEQIEDYINGMGEVPTLQELQEMGILDGGAAPPSPLNLRERLGS